jgi:hypothetical protein
VPWCSFAFVLDVYNTSDIYRPQALIWVSPLLKGSKMEDQTCKTISVPEAGRRYFELGKNASYEAARRGELPVIKIGSRLRVPVIALERMLHEASEKLT